MSDARQPTDTTSLSKGGVLSVHLAPSALWHVRRDRGMSGSMLSMPWK